MATSGETRFGRIQYRPGTNDRQIWCEAHVAYRAVAPWVTRGHILDVGAHIGGFTRWTLSAGAAKIVAVEPEPENFSLLCANTEGYPVRCVRAAVTAAGATALLSRHDGRNTGGHQTGRIYGRTDVVQVPAIRLGDLLTPRTTVVKIDIEGAEFELDIARTLTGSSVRVLVAELHLTSRAARISHAPQLVSDLQAQRWSQLISPDIGSRNWTTIAAWLRSSSADG